ncbi:LSM domain-containing protein [Natranaeroarchaeum sulfidigenes]|uniref:Small nuclear ribonucleoprotein (SnRNP)-like protein n=1 Tax=Natranaeroarchaeum sulfidigenes TaxID=2784880 RepID=A0A897MWR3_9EURY|nr:LSM domain-containing protein [Natranaeroarchaeum sulfidigenes]QSG02755.1 Small nuclear ribonucleoprotein (snRNP)-like protein [Natranaeroarchaeum sulfidigenes]
MSGRPLDVLEASLGEDVQVQLKGGEIYEGRLTGYDQHMNLVLEDAMKVPAPEDPTGDSEAPVEDTTIIRGDNVVSIIP